MTRTARGTAADDGGPLRRTARLPAHRRRAGASLVMVLAAVATVVSLALGAAALSRNLRLRTDARAGRAALRDQAESALARAAWAIDADTNLVDALSEPWAADSARAAAGLAAGGDGVFVVVEDERARLGLPEAGARTLGHLLMRRSTLDESEAMGDAAALLFGLRAAAAGAAGGRPEDGGTNAVLHAEEELLDLPHSHADALAAALPLLSAHAGDRINVNTVGHDVLVSVARGHGAAPGGAEGLWRRLERSRGRGEVFVSDDPAEALKLLQGEGDRPTAEELEALELVRPALRVDSGLFRITATARRGGVFATVQCVYERGTGRFLRWTEF